MKESKKLELCLLNYFLLIAIAAVMIGVEFYFEMSKPGLMQDICASPTAVTEIIDSEIIDPDKDALSPALSNLRNKIVVMFGVLTLVVSIVMMMFVKNITSIRRAASDVYKRQHWIRPSLSMMAISARSSGLKPTMKSGNWVSLLTN